MSLTDKEYYQLTISINKALNPIESALKTKHARAAIIATFRSNGAHSFWAVIIRQPLQENRFIAWKFCHLLHKVLREGHALCIQHSQRHKTMLIELGKLWGHLTDGYGICIRNYTKLLVNKLDFHDRNPQFPGNLVLSREELEKIGGNDINIHFQLGVEMFDYLDDIITLQSTIFSSVNHLHISSMTPAGQCRLAPLIPLIQDSSQLYDFVVRLMFKLHLNLPSDILAGHRERFRTVFRQLKSFYDQARVRQFFANLIQIPSLPENAPNFTSKVDFGSYVPPVVVVPEPDPVVDNLVDMTATDDQRNQRSPDPPTPTIDLEKLLLERDNLIMHLQVEIDRLNKYIKAMTIGHRDIVNQMDERISKLNGKVTEFNEQLTNMRLQKEELELKANVAPTLEQKAIAEEERAKATEEKFQKLKSMYTQIRDEHVKLLRQHGEITKQLSTTRTEISELVKAKELLQVQLDEFKETTSTETTENEKVLMEKLESLQHNHDQLKFKFDDLQADKSAEIAELQIKIENLKKVRDDFDKLSLQHRMLEEIKMATETSKNDLNKELQKLVQEKSEIEMEKQSTETEMLYLKSSLEQKTSEYDFLENEKKILIENYSKEIELLQQTINTNEEKFKATNAMLERITEDKSNVECDLHDLLHQQAEIEEKHKNALQMIAALESSLQDCRISGDTKLRALLETCIKSSEKLAVRAVSEKELTSVAATSAYFMMLSEELQEVLNEVNIVYSKYDQDNTAVEGLARKSIMSGHLVAAVYTQGITICNTSQDIECGESIENELKHFGQEVTELFECLHNLTTSEKVTSNVERVKARLKRITTMIHEMTQKSSNQEQIGDMLEAELSSMDKAIEEAANQIVEMLANARNSDSGIKLEVNQKILDACTELMQFIRILVQKSKVLQREIVSHGRGTASVKEFYKRNHQWTEGLISASKSVALGANLLVDAANKAVSGESKHHLDLVVAAQEIAASTAQLVVASRVKAPRGSANLQALSAASRNVTHATGVVVATAKDSSQQLEDSNDLDLTKLTPHQAKTLEMEIQVKVLGLEQALQTERERLAAIRRKNYRDSEEK